MSSNSTDQNEQINARDLENSIHAELSKTHGPIIGGSDLWKCLGFKTSAAFRQSLYRKTLDIDIFTIKNRRGSFSMTRDVARWLSQVKHKLK